MSLMYFQVDYSTFCCWPKWDHLEAFEGYNFKKTLLQVLKNTTFQKNLNYEKRLLVQM